MLAVFVGGYLMAGGANAVNMYIDRDIDDRMARTRLRPIPSGRMQPRAVLAFGVLLATAATFLLAHVANVLTAALALAGFYFYVFVYTRWLKRSTPQNIVIGGAAGAFPPLVGWAAVTGRVDLIAVYLFLIIFYWTPPHFWALALLKQRDYGTRRRADGAARLGRARDEAADAVVHADPHSAHAAAGGVRRARHPVSRDWRRCSAAGCSRGVMRVMRASDFVKPAWRSTSSRCSTSRCSSRRWSWTGRSRERRRRAR